MKHILLAIDRSAPSWEATRLLVHMAPRLEAPVTVLSVVPETPRSEADARAREFEAVRDLVDDVVKQLIKAGVRATGDVRSSKPNDVAGEIVAAAIRVHADLIVMGGRARGELTGLLLGSVSHQVAMGAGRPVVIVPAAAGSKVTPRRIVLVIDGEGDLERPLTATAELAHALKASVEVVCASRTLGDDLGSAPDSSGRRSRPRGAHERCRCAQEGQELECSLDDRKPSRLRPADRERGDGDWRGHGRHRRTSDRLGGW